MEAGLREADNALRKRRGKKQQTEHLDIPVYAPHFFSLVDMTLVFWDVLDLKKLELFGGHDPTRGSGEGAFQISRVASGRVKKCSKVHGSGRVGLQGLQISPVGSGQVRSRFFRTSRVGSGRVGSGWVGSGRAGSITCPISRVESDRAKR